MSNDDTPTLLTTLQADNAALRQRIAELEEQNTLLYEQQAIMQRVVDTSTSIIYAKDTHGRYLLINKQAATILGKDRADILGKTDAELLPPEIAVAFHDGDQTVLTTAKSLEREEVLTIGGKELSYLAQSFPIFDDQGSIIAVGGIASNITRIKQTEKQLRASEAQNKALLDAIPDLIFRITSEGIFVDYKAVRHDALAIPPEVFLGNRLADVLAPDIAVASMQRITEALKTGEVQDYQYEMDIQGSLHSFEARYSVCGEDEVIIIIRDITDWKQAEQNLRIYKTLVDQAPDGIVVLVNNVVTYANSSYCQLLGYEEQEVIGLTNDQVSLDDQQQHIRHEMVAALQTQGTWQGSYWYQRKNESNRMFLSHLSVFAFSEQDATTGMYDLSLVGVIMRDMTKQQQDEAERTQLQQQVIEAQQMAIRELSTPLIPLSPTVVLMPLIGNIDSRRAQLVMETLLEGIATYQAEMAIVDITGVSVVDTQVANALIQTARAVQLLGAKVVLTGIGPTMALTLVHLGADLSSITTRGNLQRAVADALGNK